MSTSQIHTAVLDIGSSNIRASAVDRFGKVVAEKRSRFETSSPSNGFFEFDPDDLFDKSIRLLEELIQYTSCSALAITNQRSSAVVFDPVSNRAVFSGIGWQDLRTAPLCLALKSKGFSLAPNQTATKIALILDLVDSDRSHNLRAGTIDAWIAYRLTGTFSTDHTNVAMTGLVKRGALEYDEAILNELRIPQASLPEIRTSLGYFGEAAIGTHRLPLVAILGDQQASMIGQKITRPGRLKITFGTGAMANAVLADTKSPAMRRLDNGSYPIVARSHDSKLIFGIEAAALQAGSAVEFACKQLELAGTPSGIEDLSRKHRQGGKEIFVPAMSGLGSPYWDFGALGSFSFLSKSTSKADLAFAVLSGIAHLGTDLIGCVESDANIGPEEVSVDGGMSKNRHFLELLATYSSKTLVVSTSVELTTVGAGLAAHLAIGSICSWEELDAVELPVQIIRPEGGSPLSSESPARLQWFRAVEISRNSVPELSSVTF